MSARFDLAMLACCAAMVLGGYVLAWASDRGLTWRADSVFSPWAALLYAGFLPAAYLLLTVAAGSPGPTIRARAPEGYEAATVGSVLFIAGVVLSLLIPGEDFPLAGLVSPQTLLMFLGGMLLVSGPLVSLGRRWRERDPDLDRRGTGLSFAVALGLLLAVLTLLTSFAHPFSLDLTVAARTSPATAAQTDLYLLPLDGSGGRRLTVTPDAYEANPAVSPDGSRVAFSRGVPATFDLYTVRLDGSDERRLTQAPGDDNGATWSPTGQAIAFWGDPPKTGPAASLAPGPAPAPGPVNATVAGREGAGIWVAAADGAGAAMLPGTDGGNGPESWSRDGQRLCGWSLRDGNFEVYTWAADGSDAQRITADPAEDWGCSWAPDGGRLAFHSFRGGHWDIWTVRPDGTDLRRLTDDEAIDQSPRWSPDGSRIAFVSSRDGETEVYVMAPDGSNATDISRDPGLDDGFWGLSWTPDGTGIVAASAGRPYAEPDATVTVTAGIAALLVQTTIVTLVLLLGAHYGRLPAGGITVVLLVGSAFLGFAAGSPELILAALAAGIAGDVMAWKWPVSPGDRARPAALTALVSSVLAAGTLVLLSFAGAGWPVAIQVGGVAMCAGLAALIAVAAGALAHSPAGMSPPAGVGQPAAGDET